MAETLTDAQIAKVKKHLRVSGLTSNAVHGFAADALFNQEGIELEEHCRAIKDADTLAEIADIITKLDGMYDALYATRTRMLVNSVGDIKLDPREEHRLRELYEEYKCDLKALLRLDKLLPRTEGGIVQTPQY